MIAGSEALVEIESNDSEVRKKKCLIVFTTSDRIRKRLNLMGAMGAWTKGEKGGGGGDAEKNNLLREL